MLHLAKSSWRRFLSLSPSIPVLLTVATACAQWNVATTASTAALRGIHNVGRGVIWASGTNGTVLRSEDDGYMWQQCTIPPEAVKLDFRAVFGWNANHAVVMSSGSGAASRLYETTDGCTSWHLLFENPDRGGFWDALTFRGNTGFILGDPVGGRFALYRSDDLGRHWHRDNSPGLDAASDGEAVFAASNSSFVAGPNLELLLVTGGVGGPRLVRLGESGSWSVAKVPLAGGKQSAGIFSIAFRDNSHGIAVGGDYKEPAQTAGTAAWTSDGGATWHSASAFPSGYRSSVAWDQKTHAWIAVGPNGGDLSLDDGRTWKRFDSGNWNALSLPWVTGPKGQIASLDTASPAFVNAIQDGGRKE
jgi:photosystem II stability/assembly factor-like uncharacterized protein